MAVVSSTECDMASGPGRCRCYRVGFEGEMSSSTGKGDEGFMVVVSSAMRGPW